MIQSSNNNRVRYYFKTFNFNLILFNDGKSTTTAIFPIMVPFSSAYDKSYRFNNDSAKYYKLDLGSNHMTKNIVEKDGSFVRKCLPTCSGIMNFA